MKNSAFTLLELVIAVALSSLIALMLYATFMTTNTSVASISETTAYQMMVATLYHQLEKDIYGIAVPQQFLIQLKKETDKPKEDPSPEDEKEKPKGKKERNIPPLKEVFHYSEQKRGLKQLTFITYNALSYYTDSQQEDSTPLLVRILYQLKEDPDSPGTYRLLRTQGKKLEAEGLGADKQAHAYELARGIKKFKITFFKEVIEEKKEPNKEDASESEKKRPKQFAQVSTWSSDEIKSGEPIIPAFIQMEFAFDLGAGQREEEFMFMVAVSDNETIKQMLPKDEPQSPEPSAPKNGEQQKPR